MTAAAELAAVLARTPCPRLGLLTAAVAVVAVLAGDGRAALAVAGVAWPVGNGFLVNRYGELSWHGWLDGWFVIGLLAAAATGTVTGAARRALRQRRRWHPFAVLLGAQAGRLQPMPRLRSHRTTTG
ncbi:hypothetical protein ACNTMW_24800 [Planosporangium sp. 12N6]|uniref:hypothetical protein n=1 Tax=Planosporangium spinosum TaxID=3402278 RepID=UPI003CEB195C